MSTRSKLSGVSRFSLLVVIFLSGCAAIQGGGERSVGRFEFGLMGDQQYTPQSEAQFPNLVDELNRANLAFVVHVGDFKEGATPCSDETFNRRKEQFQSSKHPFIYTPGDNEWTDCHGAKPPSDPLERLAKLRELFFRGDHSLGGRILPLTRQSSDPQYGKFRENVRWLYGDVVFVTLHIVGSNNNLGRTPEMDREYAERNGANLAWMRQVFDLAKRNGHRAIVLITQANPRFVDTWPPRLWRLYLGAPVEPPKEKRKTGYADFLQALEKEVLAFDKSVVLMHGDTHIFRVDKPLLGSKSMRMVENFTRVETFGAPDSHWVRVIVDPDDPNLFTFKPEIVKKNLVDHQAK